MTRRLFVVPRVLLLLAAGSIAAGSIAACSGGDGPSSPTTTPVVPITPTPPANTEPVRVVSVHTAIGSTVGTAFTYDATKNGVGFTDPRGTGLTYAVSFAPSANGLTAASGRIAGTPVAPGIVTVTIVATDATGSSATTSFPVVAFASDLSTPVLPTSAFVYSDASLPLPAHFSDGNAPGGTVIATDNTPVDNAVTNAGAALGRVLFYDRRMSVNDRVSCASCHQQQFGFADTARLSRGFAGGLTGRHSMSLANARFYQRGRFFWDERAATLEAQVLQPLQDATEMGMSLDGVVTKLSTTTYYPALFQAAFGSAEITSDRVARALAQFVRSLVSRSSRFDRAFAAAGPPNFAAVFTAEELQGQQLFNGAAGCARCHATNAQVSDNVHNTGLDATVIDAGAGQGRFKAPSLRNVAVRAPYMHDGRFTTLDAVVDFYDNGVRNNPNLDQRLRVQNGQPQRLNLSPAQKAALVAYMRTLNDESFLTNPAFADPYAR